jgi:hypothetical protein
MLCSVKRRGLNALVLHPTAARSLDVRIRLIPARPGEPAHHHLDLRYPFLAPDAGEEPKCARCGPLHEVTRIEGHGAECDFRPSWISLIL